MCMLHVSMHVGMHAAPYACLTAEYQCARYRGARMWPAHVYMHVVEQIK